MKLSKPVIAIGILGMIAAGIMGVKAFQGMSSTASGNTEHIKGNSSASIQIVEYMDFQCPACVFGAKMVKEYVEKHPDKIGLKLKHFPLRMHQHAETAAIYTECAGRQNKFWEFHDMLVNGHALWSKSTLVTSHFQGFAKKLNLNLDKLAVCIEKDEIRQKIRDDQSDGNALGIRSTPTYFVNEERLVGPKSLKLKLDELLGAASE